MKKNICGGKGDENKDGQESQRSRKERSKRDRVKKKKRKGECKNEKKQVGSKIRG